MKLKSFYVLKKQTKKNKQENKTKWKEEYTFQHIPSLYDYSLLAHDGISPVFSIKMVSEVILQTNSDNLQEESL